MKVFSRRLAAALVVASLGLAAAGALAQAPKTVDVTDKSFGCIRDMKPVRGFYVGNLLGNVDATLKVANSDKGGVYPVGSLVQLVPTEAMVKREAGFSAATGDWEYFELVATATGTKINVRGTTEAKNRFGGNCSSCHSQAAAQWNNICESTHGCAPIPITPIMAKAIQNTDPRCPKMDLPPEQIEAMKQLQAMMAPRPAATPAPAPQ